MDFEQEFAAFRLTVLRELAGLRQEVRELPQLLQPQNSPPPSSPSPPPSSGWRPMCRRHP